MKNDNFEINSAQFMNKYHQKYQKYSNEKS